MSKPATPSTALPSTWIRTLMVALSLSIGWGIRGNFGHEIGALLPGALAAAAVVVLSGRPDWHRRVAFFAVAGALGWSLGGSMSYMWVIGYTHSGHWPSILYGFVCLFVIGFLWGAPGGAATALPAVVTREQLTGFFSPVVAIAAVWTATALAIGYWDTVSPDFRQDSPLYWYDTSWIEALGVLVAVLGLAAVRRRWDFASSLLVHAAVGWWAAFLVLVPGLGLRMTPPRGDNWAGAVGIVLGLVVFLWRRGLWSVLQATLITGVFGGVGFSGATLFKLCGMATGFTTNWHSVLEQTYGFINGLGVAAALFWLALRSPPVTDDPAVRPWTEPWAVGFAFLGITYLNLRQNVQVWVAAKSVPPTLYRFSAETWHESAWFLMALAFALLTVAHRRRPLALLPTSWLGRGQLLYLALLWSMAAGNFMRALVGFAPQRLITEGVIHLNVILCTLGILTCAPAAVLTTAPAPSNPELWKRRIRQTASIGFAVAIVSTISEWGVVRAIYGDKFAGYAGKHIRFGPDATSNTARPVHGQPHP